MLMKNLLKTSATAWSSVIIFSETISSWPSWETILFFDECYFRFCFVICDVTRLLQIFWNDMKFKLTVRIIFDKYRLSLSLNDFTDLVTWLFKEKCILVCKLHYDFLLDLLLPNFTACVETGIKLAVAHEKVFPGKLMSPHSWRHLKTPFINAHAQCYISANTLTENL